MCIISYSFTIIFLIFRISFIIYGTNVILCVQYIMYENLAVIKLSVLLTHRIMKNLIWHLLIFFGLRVFFKSRRFHAQKNLCKKLTSNPKRWPTVLYIPFLLRTLKHHSTNVYVYFKQCIHDLSIVIMCFVTFNDLAESIMGLEM